MDEDTRALFDALLDREATDDVRRAALGRAITLVESRQAARQAQGQELVEQCLPHSGGGFRLGITGIPGVGKSSLIDALGMALVAQGRRVAVLAVDPSGQGGDPGLVSGSILGDKTRMERLSRHPQAFIRPSPSSGMLGGVARRTREVMVLCEAAGYDRVLVETVGVGQSELAVERMTDLNLLLVIAGAGDELQGIKRGIMEAADLLVLNKSDALSEQKARTTVNDLRNALALLPARAGGHRAAVVTCSAVTGQGVDGLMEAVDRLVAELREKGHFEDRRRGQARWWMRQAIEEALLDRFHADPAVAGMLPDLEAAVMAGGTSPFRAAQLLLDHFRKGGAPLP